MISDLTPWDYAVLFFARHGLEFERLVAEYLTCDPLAGRYSTFGPNYMMLFELRKDEEGHFWYVVFAVNLNKESGMSVFPLMMPFWLDRIAFKRLNSGEPERVRIYPTTKFISKKEYHGRTIWRKQTKSTDDPRSGDSRTDCAGCSPANLATKKEAEGGKSNSDSAQDKASGGSDRWVG